MRCRSRASSACRKARARAARPRRRARRAAKPPPAKEHDMELKVTSLDGAAAGTVELSDAIFGLSPRTDLIQRCVTWQLAKRQRGTHKVKNRAEINRTGKK